eukprot:TRINITY_DN10559_c0_g1_i1.p1 TRINITY_DN10559_c0_g1~~TRINITY_DN10559_c0_g1_i1.p1  ORF type:complete len:329 (+),score=53.18 TRINITY_DN10559_c0_g1_i1:215-1201(+)
MPMGPAVLKQASQDFETGCLLLHSRSKLIGFRRLRKARKVMLKTARPLAGTLRDREQNVPKPLLRRPKPAASRLPALCSYVWQALLGCGCRRRKQRLSWNHSVQVCSFSRRLGGGDAVPFDGSVIALGLGSLVERSESRLASSGVMSDQISWMPAEQREKVLADAMGGERFARARAQQGPELQQLLERRQSSKQDGKDMSLMPTSWKEALDRASQLSAEVTAKPVEQLWAGASRQLSDSPVPISKPQRAYVADQPRCGLLLTQAKTARMTKLTVANSSSWKKCCKHSFKKRKMLFRTGKTGKVPQAKCPNVRAEVFGCSMPQRFWSAS